LTNLLDLFILIQRLEQIYLPLPELFCLDLEVDVTSFGSTTAQRAGVEPVTTNVDERLSVSTTSDVELHSYEGRSITQLP